MNAIEQELVEVLNLALDLTSREKGWGTWPRMEGSELYAEVSKFRIRANAAIAAYEAMKGKTDE